MNSSLLSLLPSLHPIVWLPLTENEDLTQMELKLLVVEGRNVSSLEMESRALAFQLAFIQIRQTQVSEGFSTETDNSVVRQD